ncbi:hypothetical protein [Rhizobium ruizarguesonis]|uniref:hypothetical protein n=1 Tax=Rhizobium ruizarguesonis TaxID=2081791 RepID=UPI0013E0578E|nr:hypothetical protein [Rhizobium ruizarguesonis]
MSTKVPSKKEDAAANAGFRTAPAPSNANPPSTIFLRVHGIGNIPLKPSSEVSVNQIFHLRQQKIRLPLKTEIGLPVFWINFAPMVALKKMTPHLKPAGHLRDRSLSALLSFGIIHH